MIRYQITSLKPSTHYFTVEIKIDKPNPQGQVLRMPNWIPGSYMIRDFARNLIDLEAYCDDEKQEITQLDKSNWQVSSDNGSLLIRYKVYARDFSVRGAHLDHSHGYYNGSSVFLEVLGQSDEPCEILIQKPVVESCVNWKLATSLPRGETPEFEFGLYQAASYDELIDHPVEMGEFQQLRFEACGVTHDVILTGRFKCDDERLVKDLKAICEHHIGFFGEPAPMFYYQFQVLVIGSGYGGLEHRSSTSLICSRDSLPQPGQLEVSEAYRDFLGLCSHEYFHTWNVKRIKPAVYQPYNLQQEVYTELLWAFEGITSYYDDLALLRCGLIDTVSYLELLAQTMTRIQRGIGSRRQSAAESSFNTWTKFYKQDENAQNAIVSYYAKGCLIALCIDLKMRSLSQSKVSLDDVMQALWQQWLKTGAGIEINTIQELVNDLTGVDCTGFIHQLTHGVSDMPLAELLSTVDIELTRRVAANQQDKGGKVIDKPMASVDAGLFLQERDGGLQIVRVVENGSAQSAGLSAEDVVIAVNGLKLNLSQFEQQLLFAQPGDNWTLHVFRRDELIEFDLELQAAQENTIVLQLAGEASPAAKAWLHIELND